MQTRTTQRNKRPRPYRVWLAAACLALAVLLPSCREASGRTETGEILIKFWNGFTGPGTPHIQDLVNEFNKEHHGRIRIEMSVMLWSDFYVKVPLALKGRMPPDCGAAHVPQTAAFARAGMLESIGEHLDDFDADDIFPNAWESGEVDGVRYGIPLAINPLTLFWNKQLFRRAGLDSEKPPRSREEFIEFAKQLTRDENGDGTPDTWGIMIPLGWPVHFLFYSLAYSNGGALTDAEERTCMLGGEAGQDAAQFLYDLIYTHRVSPANVEINADAEGFASGKAAMHINGLWMYPQFLHVNDLEMGCAMLPNLGTSERVAWCSSENLVVFNHRYTSPERTAACVEFFKYLSRHGQKWAKVGTIPARKSLYQDPALMQLPHIASLYPDVDHARILERTLVVEESLGPVVEGLLKALAGKGDPREEIRKGAEVATKLLRQDPD